MLELQPYVPVAHWGQAYCTAYRISVSQPFPRLIFFISSQAVSRLDASARYQAGSHV